METRYKEPTKKVKKKRLNIGRTLVFILFIYLVVCFCYYLYNTPVKHYEISGNKYLSDADILEYLEIEDYPSYLSLNSNTLEKKLKNNDLIINAKVKHGLYFYIYIEVEENTPMYILKSNESVVLKDGSIIQSNEKYNLPMLLNDTPTKVMQVLAKNLDKVSYGIRTMISEIRYDPSYNNKNEIIDEYRFLLYMSDDNLVYITAKRAKILDKYLDVIANNAIEGKGTLYLDGDEERYSFKYFNEVKNES